MVDNSSRLICYYNGCSGGTAFTVRYAGKKGLEIVNLFEVKQAEKGYNPID